MNRRKTQTSSFGSGGHECHDSSAFYTRSIFHSGLPQEEDLTGYTQLPTPLAGDWADQIYCHSAEDLSALPDNSIGLAFTSPPYNVGKDYEDNLGMPDYMDLIGRVGREVYRSLLPGGRYVINVANLGRKPYIPLHSLFYGVHLEIGFLPMGEIIWQKANGANKSTAWGSWRNAKSPRLRDVHEYLLVFAKQSYTRPDRGESSISRDEFMAATLSTWQITPALARRVGHPAPFPVELAERVIRLFSYVDDVILDPFVGSGTTCVAALQNQRHYVGFDIDEAYCEMARERIAKAYQKLEESDDL